MTVTYALRVNYSVAIVAMTDEKEAREGFEVRNQLNTLHICIRLSYIIINISEIRLE